LGMLRNRTAVRIAEALERRIYRAAQVITVPTRGLEQALAAVPEAAERVERIAPAVDVERFPGAPPEPRAGPLQVLYAGTIGLAQGLDTLVAAAAIAGPEVVQVRIAGGGADSAHIAATAPANVELLGIVPHDRVPGLYAASEASVVLLRDRPVFAGALPTKLLEAMAAARPVVVSAHGEAAMFVEQAGAGLVVPPEDPEQLATAFRRLQAARAVGERMGRAGRAFAERELSREASLDRWQSVLERAVSSR
jgi:colanic acid biosynthesis glycosyl transferase WcaI